SDYLIIAHELFLEEIQRFAQFRESLGNTVTVVDVQHIYDQFDAGHSGPLAIKDFISYASTHWQGTDKADAATYVLLVGDSTSSYRDNFRNDVINYVPTITKGFAE